MLPYWCLIDHRQRELGAALACTLALTAFGSPAEAQVRGGTLRVRLAGDLTSLDPAFNTTPPERHVLHQVVNTLVGVDDKLHVVPELAESWKWEGDTALVLKLRRGIKFHDGTDFDAAAVKFNIDRLLATLAGGNSHGAVLFCFAFGASAALNFSMSRNWLICTS